jgi:O-acetylhomoserine/O-acetylserine sulfhydrylase-like pyridoxal-dependent enzyme
MNGKKERQLLVVGLKKLLRKKSKIVEDYRALAEMLEGIPAGLFLDWVVIEEEAHHTLLIRSLKKTTQKESGNCANGVEIERDTTLCWVERLKMKEQAVVADCRSLKAKPVGKMATQWTPCWMPWLWIVKNIRDFFWQSKRQSKTS